ncbi:unnamed protein product [Paramecium primaurelia]|uniref:Uncharacterized protein n=1 Tax=Paramecium primaurelia TaxID=5886 RepID=A0A8S1PRS3_PARPR|nr:unnamed protein product [Paramecium primaurelia]
MSTPQFGSEQDEEELIAFVNEILREQRQEKQQIQINILPSSDEKNIPIVHHEVCLQTDPITMGEIDSLIGNFEQMTFQKSIYQQIQLLGACACFKLCEIFSGNEQPLTRIKMDALREKLNKQTRETIFRQNRNNYYQNSDQGGKKTDDHAIQKAVLENQQLQQQDELDTCKQLIFLLLFLFRDPISTKQEIDVVKIVKKSKPKIVLKKKST